MSAITKAVQIHDAGLLFNMPEKMGTFIESVCNDDDLAEYIPKINPDYYFRETQLRDVLSFLNKSFGDGLFLFGPTGCGKTSCIEQVCARLRRGAISVTCYNRMEFVDLVGQYVVQENGSMKFVYGPLALAMKYGLVLILNEVDLLDPGELAGLNGVLEGSKLVIPQNGGEIIVPDDEFRFIATANTGGNGDESGAYQGTNQLNKAFMDRFIVLKTDYVDEEVEVGILMKSLREGDKDLIPGMIVKQMVNLANDVRRLFVGESNADETLEDTFSTRTLLRWGREIIRSSSSDDQLNIKYALEKSLLNRMSDQDAIVTNRLAKNIFGDYWA